MLVIIKVAAMANNKTTLMLELDSFKVPDRSREKFSFNRQKQWQPAFTYSNKIWCLVTRSTARPKINL